MKKLFGFVILIGVLFFSGFNSYAVGYGAGGELIYKYINDSTYRFYYKFYRDCTGIGENNQFSLCYRNTCSGIWYTQYLQKADFGPDGQPNGQMVDPGCVNSPNACTDPGSTVDMYRAWWYTGVVTLNEPCDDWIFSVNIDERDRDSLTNLMIYPPMQHNLYVEATIKTNTAPHQSSPYLTSPPPIYTASGVSVHFNLGAIDPDGDSLAYELIQPRSATTDILVVCAGYPPFPLPFSGPQYNLTNNPLETNNTFNLNAVTGDVTFTPQGNQVAYLAFLIKKYRNGQLIGTVMRDSRIEVHTETSPDVQFNWNPNTLTGGTLIGNKIYACVNTPLSFCYNATTPSTANLVLGDNRSWVTPNATISYQGQGTNNASGCFNWTAHANDTGWHNFLVTIKDSTCGTGNFPVTQSYVIPIYIRPAADIQLGVSVVCPGADLTLNGYGGSSFSWSTLPGDTVADFSCAACGTTQATLHGSTHVILETNINNGCPSKDTVSLNVDYSNGVTIDPPGPIVFCGEPGYVQFNANAYGPPPLKQVSCTGSGSQPGQNTDSAQFAQNSNNSTANNMMYNFVEYYGPFDSHRGTQKMQVIYRANELKTAGMESGVLKGIALNYATPTGNSTVTFSNVRISVRCTSKNEFTAYSQGEFEIGLTQVYMASSLTLHQGWNDISFLNTYDYDSSQNLVIQFCYDGASPLLPSSTGGYLPIYYMTTPYKSCIAAGQTTTGNACANSIGTIQLYNRRPDIRLIYTDMPATNFSYSWTPATGMDNPGAAQTGVFPQETTWYTVTTKGRNGCEVKDSVLVYISDNHFSVDPEKQEICQGDVAVINVNGGAYSTIWYNADFTTPVGFDCLQCNPANITGTDTGTFYYKVIAADSFGCADTLNAQIRVKPISHTVINTPESTIIYGSSIQLEASGADYYQWTPANSLSDANSPNPVASPKENTEYIVTGFTKEGCQSKDSVLIEVNMNEDVFLPNAFTPNGDGINDLFQIVNLTFQKVQAFRVFNRFGQLVYDGTDNNNKGWNGMIKGKKADMGNYYYFIQLAYPDGSTKQYKGSVLLVQ